MSRPTFWLSPTDLDVLALCEYLAEHAHPDGLADDLSGFTAPSGADVRGVMDQALAEHFLIPEPMQQGFGQSFPPVRLGPHGLRHLTTTHERQQDPRAKARAARQAFLLWCEGEEFFDPAGFLGADPSLKFWGTAFTEDEVEGAVSYLMNERLIESLGKVQANGQPGIARLTNAGIDCVENYDGDVAAYKARRGQAATITQNTQNIHGSYIAQNAQGQDIVQHQIIGVDLEALAAIFAPLRESLVQVEDAEVRDDLVTVIDDLEQAARRPGPDLVEVQRRSRIVNRLATTAGNAAVAAAASEAAKNLLHLLGGIVN